MSDLLISDLRPHLGLLNWQLRRIGKRIEVLTQDYKVIDLVVKEGSLWIVTCDSCQTVYEPGKDTFPKCPHCGTIEIDKPYE